MKALTRHKTDFESDTLLRITALCGISRATAPVAVAGLMPNTDAPSGPAIHRSAQTLGPS